MTKGGGWRKLHVENCKSIIYLFTLVHSRLCLDSFVVDLVRVLEACLCVFNTCTGLQMQYYCEPTRNLMLRDLLARSHT